MFRLMLAQHLPAQRRLLRLTLVLLGHLWLMQGLTMFTLLLAGYQQMFRCSLLAEHGQSRVGQSL
jgi:hypothetical protein